MYCPACRQERLGSARQCVLCGTSLSARARSAIEAELAHVHFLLDEAPRWEASDVPAHVRRWLTERYERQARVLLSILTETPAEALTPAPEPVAVPNEAFPTNEFVPTPMGEGAAAVGPVMFAAPEAAATASVPAEAQVANVTADAPEASEAPVAHALTEAVVPEAPKLVSAAAARFTVHDAAASLGVATPDTVAGRLPVATRLSAESRARAVNEQRAAESRARAVNEQRAAASRRLPPNPAEPFMDPPAPAGRTARLVEEASSWSRVWRPFLYESIAWFIGAFLILSGTLYFVFESWAGMTSVTRSLTVFLMTVGYSVGFSVWGGFLARRESLRKPGHILGLIGSAVAPLGGVALGPMGFGESLQLDGVHPALLVPLLFVWAGVAAFLARKPAESFDAPSRPFIQVGLVGATLIMGLAPLAARLGAPAVWLNALPCLLFFLLSSKPLTTPRKGDALAFAIAAPLYLTALFAIRLHLALGSADASVPAGTYAPFVAFLLATCLRFRTLDAERSADPLAIGTVALQVACLAGAIGGTTPALFLTAAIFTGTLVALSRGPVSRLPWLYPAYAGAYLSYASSVQLVPHAATVLLNALKTRLGYPPSEVLPFQYGALTAIPFVLAGLVLAFRLQRRGERSDSSASSGAARDLGIADVLLRATTWAAPAFALYGHLGTDARPAFFATLALAVLSLGAGLLFKRFPLTAVGSVLFAVLPISGAIAFGLGTATVIAGVLALGLAGLVWRLEDARTQRFLSAVVGVLATSAFCLALGTRATAAPVMGMALGSAGVLVAAFRLRNDGYVAYGAFLAAALLPKLATVHSTQAVLASMVGGALVLALLGERGGLLKRLGIPALLYAGLAVSWGLVAQQPFLGPVLLTAAATVAVVSRTFPVVRPFAVVLVGLALLPDVPWYYSGWHLPPAVSLVLLIAASLLASVVAAHKGRSASTVTAGILALVLPLVPVELAPPGQQTVFLLGAALAALFTTRALPSTLGVLMATIEAGVALYTVGPLALLGLATFLSVLALLDDVPAVRRIATGGQSFSLVSTLTAMAVLVASTVCWEGHSLARAPGATLLALLGPALLPLLWTRTLRQPFAAALMVPFGLVGIVAVGTPPAWVALLPLYPLLLVRVAEHVPSAASLLLRSADEAPRHALSKWMQVAVAALGVLSLLVPEQRAALVSAVALVLMTGPLPSLRVGVASALLMFIPEARPFATVLLLALALAAHHVPGAVAAFFRGARDEALRPTAVGGALAVTLLSVLSSPTPAALTALGGVLLAATFLLSQRWLLTAAVWAFSLAPIGLAVESGSWRPEAGPLVAGVALAAALLSAACQSGAVQRTLTNVMARLTPGIEGTWSEPLWVGSAGTLTLLLGLWLVNAGPGALPLPVALVAGATALVLMVTRERLMMNGATALLGAVLVAAVPPLWAPAILAGVGLVLALVGFGLDARGVAVGAALHHGGAVLALLSLAGLRHLKHPGMPVCVLFAWATAWTVVLRRREREWLGWAASLFAVHALIVHFGAVYSTGRGAEFILPYFGAASALLATLVLTVAGRKVRGPMGLGFSGVALAEVVLAVMTVHVPGGASREAWVACGGLVFLLFALVRRAAKEEDEAAAWMAQAVVAAGYLCVRLIGVGASPSAPDSLASLIGGAVFTGLYLFVRREGAGLKAFRRPSIAGAWLFPLAGLLSLPWGEPFVAVALLVGYAAHFAALAACSKTKGPASLVSVAAFNTALFFVWLGTGTGEPQYYAIPAGLSVLALLRVFRGGLSQDAYAQLRAVAVTCIYVAGAWKPLLFNDGEAMLLCVFLCLVGVGAGIALRIRSYVYLGSAFLVTAVAANLVRFGMRDHRVGAAFLSLLGLLVVGFMVVLSAHRAALLQRYARVRDLLATWEG
ncbi:hypothetical protein [Corallococcus sicarius]|uniref:Uncharacterized protein n=1 Tax=Corallococcus sicarius TaxID=2316726 RepID=A0A3A8P769_9BACT|nr:hypothetical protein [Corallococcus sicarius]RKH48262.1 hypothetical protein D7X12_00450 [Corallococcus sicarius]